jgi:hypothetical protein
MLGRCSLEAYWPCSQNWFGVEGFRYSYRFSFCCSWASEFPNEHFLELTNALLDLWLQENPLLKRTLFTQSAPRGLRTGSALTKHLLLGRRAPPMDCAQSSCMYCHARVREPIRLRLIIFSLVTITFFFAFMGYRPSPHHQ